MLLNKQCNNKTGCGDTVAFCYKWDPRKEGNDIPTRVNEYVANVTRDEES
jgi:hypothetical protein